MKQFKITINQKEVFTTEGKTILEAVHENKVDKIPTLCHDGRIEPYGSCFLCVVEVEGIGKLVPSCCTPVTDGMVIRTNTERIRSSRKTALELLLSNHYADCIGPCINNCPAHVDAQGYIALISMGKYDEALRLIKQQNPLPLSIGRVCVRDCETACRRQIVDESVNINHLKRYVADIDSHGETLWTPERKALNGKRVAVVGGGPAGLTCAYYLTLEGYNVTIHEKLPRLGGMLMYGIPEYRLPKETLDLETQWITRLGVTVKTNVTMGKDFDLPSLSKEGYDAIFVAVGAHKATNMRLEHEADTENIMGGIDFLRQIPDHHPAMNGAVVVVGGGNTAIDAARTALRCGAKNVKIVYRRSLNEMPAHHEEIHAAQAEGIEILFLTLPNAILRDENKKLKGIVCIKMKLEEAAPGERPRPVPMEGSDFELPCDYLISAIGQQVDIAFNKALDKTATTLDLERWGTIIADKDTQVTSMPGVFAGGDAVTGPSSAISAIAHGKKAALAIDTFLKTGKVTKPAQPFFSFKHTFSAVTQSELSHFEKAPRNKMPELSVAERVNSFCEVETGYTGNQHLTEAKRCIECGCSAEYDCQLKSHADDYNVDITNYLGETRKYKVDTRHPYIVMDPNKCINCGRCVRTCSEILKVSALGFVHRGFKSVAKPAMEKPLIETNCIACGNCVDTCPTGALTEKFPFKVLGTLPKENHQTVCNYCSVGCKVNFKVLKDDIFFVANSTEAIAETHNRGYLCVKGRFGHRYLMRNVDRLKTPQIKNGNTMQDVEWQTAITTVAEKVKAIVDKYGPNAVAIFGSPKMSNEELYLLQKFARVGVKTNNISSFAHMLYGNDLHALDKAIGATTSTTTTDDIQNADVVVVLNGDLSAENLIMELKIKDAQKKHGTKLIIVNSSENRPVKFADLWIDSRKGSNTTLMNGILQHIIKNKLMDATQAKTQGYTELAAMVAAYTPEKVIATTDITADQYNQMLEWLTPVDRKIVFIYNIDSNREKSPHDLLAITNFMLLTGRFNTQSNRGGVILMREYANSTGLLDMGVNPNYLPGYVKPFEKTEIKRIGSVWGTDLEKVFIPTEKSLAQRMLQGEIKAVFVFGEDPLAIADNQKYFVGVEFLMVHDLFYTSTVAAAHVVIPAAAFIEQDGTFTACDLRVQKADAIIPSVVQMNNLQFIQALAKQFQLDLNYPSSAAVYNEIQQVNRFYKNTAEDGQFMESPLANGYHTETGKPSFSIYTTDTEISNSENPSLLYSENYFKSMRIQLQFRN